MKTLKIALFSTAIALAPAAYAQVVDQPVETEEQAPETAQDTDAADMQAPETPETETEEASPEVSNADDTYSEPMAL
ncbi:MAG: hypothetical protein ACK4IS_06610 [Erythrobacter sp.]